MHNRIFSQWQLANVCLNYVHVLCVSRGCKGRLNSVAQVDADNVRSTPILRQLQVAAFSATAIDITFPLKNSGFTGASQPKS